MIPCKQCGKFCGGACSNVSKFLGKYYGQGDPEEALKGLKIAVTKTKPAHEYQDSLKSVAAFAAYHECSLKIAWDATCGKHPKYHGVKNPYGAGGAPPVHALSGDGTWGDILHAEMSHWCEACSAQAQMAGKSLTLVNPSPHALLELLHDCDESDLLDEDWLATLVPSQLYRLTGIMFPMKPKKYIRNAAMAVIDDFMDTDEDEEPAWAEQHIAKTFPPIVSAKSEKSANTPPPITTEELLTLLHGYEATDQTSEKWLASLQPEQLYCLTGIMYQGPWKMNSWQKQIYAKAQAALDEYMQLHDSQEVAWAENHLAKISSPVAATHISGNSLNATSLGITSGFTSIDPHDTIKYLAADAAVTSTIHQVYGVKVPPWKKVTLKPGDQMVIQATEAGTVHVPEGMSVVVVPK